MAASISRRSAKRKRPQSGSKDDAPTSKGRSSIVWVNEALAVFIFVVSLFLAGSVVSVGAGWGFVREGAKIFEGPLGPAGEFIGTLLFGTFGWCALFLSVWGGWFGFALWKTEVSEFKEGIGRFLGRLAGVVGTTIACATISAIAFGTLGGGRFGLALSGGLISVVDVGGALLVAVALLTVCTALTLRTSVATIAAEVIRGGRIFLGFVVAELPKGLFLCGRWLFRAVVGIFVSESARSSDDEEAPVLPRPKLRKNVISKEAEPDEAIDDEDEGEEPYTHVVVNRRLSPQGPTKRGKEPVRTFPDYRLPTTSLLTKGEVSSALEGDQELLEKSRVIEAKLRDFNIQGKVTEVHPGPVITLFEFEPAAGIKVGRITSYADDLAMSLRASSIRIIAPIPKRGTVGIEVPNRIRDTVRLRDVFESPLFVESESILTVALGKDTYGEPVVADIATMPHLLMAGATGTGKSVCINAILLSLLYRATPAELGLILIDPKILELSTYDGIPHLRVPVVTVPRQARAVLQWAATEMDRRYRMMQRFGVRNIDGYNRLVRGEDEESGTKGKKKEKSNVIELEESKIVAPGIVDPVAEEPVESVATEELVPLPKIVIVIDELADLMLTVGREVEELITRLAQKARAAGIHLIVATQRPSVDVITGLIKANFPARLSFQVSSRIDSRTILDSMGAEKLLGKGDMLFIDPTVGQLRRIHGAFVSDAEVKRAVDAIKQNGSPAYDDQIIRMCEQALEEEGSGATGDSGTGVDEYDPMYDQIVQFVLDKRVASTSMIQRAFRLGYNRAARIVDKMEREGIVGPMDGAKPRQVLLPMAEGE